MHESSASSSPDRCAGIDPRLRVAPPRRAARRSAGFAFEVGPADVDETPHAERSRLGLRACGSRATRRAGRRDPHGHGRGRARRRHAWSSPTAGSSASRATTRTRRACCDRCPAGPRGADRQSSSRHGEPRAGRARCDAGALPAAELGRHRAGTSRPASRAARRAPTPSRGTRPASSTGSTGPGRMSSGCRSRP